MTSQQMLLCDNSSAANFKSWAQPVSDFIRSAGWTNSTDTGQLNGAGGGVWTGVTTVPGQNAFIYEIFQPGDGLANFYLKLEYGNSNASTNSPTFRITIGTGTDGAGTLTGFVTTPVIVAPQASTNGGPTTTYECDMSGTSGRLSFLMWRAAPNNVTQVFAIQRSLNGTGTPTGDYATVWALGYNNGSIGGFQQSLHFTAGVAPCCANNFLQSSPTGWPFMFCKPLGGTTAFNNEIPISNPQPIVGGWKFPCTVVGICFGPDITEGVTFTVTNQYGQNITYMPTKATLNVSAAINSASAAVCVEYD